MAFFTESFLNARREELLRSVCRFQYQLNGKDWKDGEINSKQIIGTNVVAFVYATNSSATDTITAVRVLDNNNNLAGEQAVSLRVSLDNTALLRFTFPLVVAE